MNPILRRVPLLLVALLATRPAMGQSRPESAPVPPSFRAFHGYAPGEGFTPHHRVEAFARALAAGSDRISIDTYGTTPEGRPLILVTVMDPALRADLGKVRAGLARLADPRRLGPGEDPAVLIPGLPVVVWLSFNVHGDEPSSSEAAMVLLEDLAAGNDAGILGILRSAIVILDPCLNPDGRDRYVNWFNSVVGRQGDPDPSAREHHQPWPGGRVNHYLFDLNRDWAFLTQDESRARVARWIDIEPHVHVDFHEMSAASSYFFFPAEKPVNANLPPSILRWGRVFGEGNARAFDARGWDYYTAEDFDLFYPGYGDSWPSLRGAVGMTYEQAGHGRAGLVLDRRDGTRLTLADRVGHHVVAARATLDTAVAHRAALLADFHEFRRTAVEEGRGGLIREFLLPPGDDPHRAAELAGLLIRQGIEVHRAAEAFEVRDVRSVLGRTEDARAFPAGTYIVSLAQPAKRLAKTLLEPSTEIRELYFYDVSAWSLPLAYGVEAWISGQPSRAPSVLLTEPPAVHGRFDDREAYAWVVRWNTAGALRGLPAMLAEGIRVRSTHKPFTLHGVSYDRGTLVIPARDNAPDLRARLRRIAEAAGIEMAAVTTGLSEKGVDLGSSSLQHIFAPRVAVVAGEGISPSSCGAVFFLLERLYGVPFTVIEPGALEATNLLRFSALVVPDGRLRLTKEARDAVAQWVRQGGALIALGGASLPFTAEQGGFTSISAKGPGGDEGPESRPRAKWIEDREEEARRNHSPGAIVKVELDPAHPLSFGYASDLPVFFESGRSFDPAAGGIHVGLFKDPGAVSGYVPEPLAKRLVGRSYVSVEHQGEGTVVLFADDPNFRCAWHGLTRLFMNAVLLLGRRVDVWPR